MSGIGEVTGARPVRPQLQEVKLSFLDRVIDAVNPKWGARRYVQRLQQARMEQVAASFGYVGGRTDRKSMKEWQPATGSADADFLNQQSTLRGRSRDLVRNAPVASGAANTSVTNIVGTGIRLSSEIDADYLGLQGDQIAEAQNELERLWRTCANRLEWEGDVESQAELQALVYRSLFESGDILVIRRSRMDPGDIVGTKVQLIEADRICNPNWQMDTDRISGGVEVDGSGRTVAYHVANRHPGDLRLEEVTSWTRVPKIGRGGLALSRLIFDKRRPGQRRGVPSLAPIMEPIKQITRLTDYELMSSVVASMFTVFVKSENPATGALPVAPVGETDVPDEGEIYMPGGGAVIDLKPGEDIVTADPNRPNGAFAPFFDALVQQIGMSLEVPFEVLMHRYQNSYSAARAAMLDAYRFFLHRRAFLAQNFCQMEYEWVVNEAVIRGIIDLPGFLTDPMAKAAWLGSNWVGPAMTQINPKDDVGAAAMRIDAGISNRKIESAMLMGMDWDREIQPQREREKEILEEAEMSFATTPGAGAAPAVEEPEDEEADAEDSTMEEEDAA